MSKVLHEVELVVDRYLLTGHKVYVTFQAYLKATFKTIGFVMIVAYTSINVIKYDTAEPKSNEAQTETEGNAR